METRQELIKIIAERYRRAAPQARARILDEFVATTGYHRKHAIGVLNNPSDEEARPRLGRRVCVSTRDASPRDNCEGSNDESGRGAR